MRVCFKDVEGKPPAQIDTDLDTHCDLDQNRYAVNACKDGTKRLDYLGLQSSQV